MLATAASATTMACKPRRRRRLEVGGKAVMNPCPPGAARGVSGGPDDYADRADRAPAYGRQAYRRDRGDRI